MKVWNVDEQEHNIKDLTEAWNVDEHPGSLCMMERKQEQLNHIALFSNISLIFDPKLLLSKIFVFENCESSRLPLSLFFF